MLQLNATNTMLAIKTAINMNKPLMVWSGPGIGKSSIMQQIAAEDNAQLVDIRLSMWDSVDVRGIPSVVDEVTVWNPPAVLPFEGNSAFDPSRPIYLFLDEAMQALPAVQSVAFQLVLDRAVGEHKLMSNVRVIMASNRQTDRGGANKMATPLANRLMHVELIAELDPWCKWAWGKDLNPLPIAFLRLKPDLLNTFDPAKGDVAFATPRSWETVCEIVSQNVPIAVRYAMIAGTVGEGPAAEVEAFMRTWERMPNIDGIIMNPDSAPIPTEVDVQYAVAAALAQRAKTGNFDNIVKYANRLPNEYGMMLVKDAVRRTQSLQLTKAFNRYAVDHADVWED
jgi:hypothetical protein